MKNQVTKQNFLDWYFNDNKDAEYIGDRLINALNDKGTFTITVESLFKDCGYIPYHICEHDQDINCDLSTDDVELIND
jgi:hypothetical protein